MAADAGAEDRLALLADAVALASFKVTTPTTFLSRARQTLSFSRNGDSRPAVCFESSARARGTPAARERAIFVASSSTLSALGEPATTPTR